MRSQASNDSETYPASQRECAQKLLFRILQCPRSQQEGHDGEWRRQYGGDGPSPKNPAPQTPLKFFYFFFLRPSFLNLLSPLFVQIRFFISPPSRRRRPPTPRSKPPTSL